MEIGWCAAIAREGSGTTLDPAFVSIHRLGKDTFDFAWSKLR